ncbi:MAG: hypothetical protein E5299_00912 [Burkholderia gladioli]|nr:MAG: hypothetical protein E5299_00912 [Burkholderia gladioli]
MSTDLATVDELASCVKLMIFDIVGVLTAGSYISRSPAIP